MNSDSVGRRKASRTGGFIPESDREVTVVVINHFLVNIISELYFYQIPNLEFPKSERFLKIPFMETFRIQELRINLFPATGLFLW